MDDTTQDQLPPSGQPGDPPGDATNPRRGGLWIALVALVAVAALALGVVATRDDEQVGGGSPRKLGLVRDGSGMALSELGDRASALYPERRIEYVLEGTLPDLGADATVYEVTGPAIDAARVGRIAEAVGLSGTPRRSDGAWQLDTAQGSLSVSTDGAAAGGYVSYSRLTGGGTSSSPGAVGGSTGSASSGTREVAPAGPPVVCVTAPCPDVAPDTPVASPGVACGPGVGCVIPPDEPTWPDDPVVTTIAEPPTPPAVEDLPDRATAERIARDLLRRMGVADLDWQAEVEDTTWGVAVACAEGVDCPPQPDPVVLARSVRLVATVDGVRVSGLEWHVTVGDRAVVESAYGVLAELRAIAPFPLRPVADVFADLQAGTAWPIGGIMAMAEAGAASKAPAAAVPAPGAEPAIAIEPDGGPGTALQVKVAGAERGLSLQPGRDGDRLVVYVVPTYRFVTDVMDRVEVLALDPAWFGVVEPPVAIQPMPEPGGVAPGDVVEPVEPGDTGEEPGVAGSGSGGAGGEVGGEVEPQPAPLPSEPAMVDRPGLVPSPTVTSAER